MKKEKIKNLIIIFYNNVKGIEKNLLARKFVIEIIYSAENIKIRFISRQSCQNPSDFGDSKSPAPHLRGGAQWLGREKENLTLPENNKFVLNCLAPQAKFSQTFTITLPNLIHQSKKKNLS